jgi:hypothetical protein
MGPTRWFGDSVSVDFFFCRVSIYLDGYVRPLLVKDLVQLKGNFYEGGRLPIEEI